MTEMKKQHSLPRVRLMRRAAVIRRNNDMNRRDALIIAHRIGGLIRKMHRENVKFCYTKQDGTVRHAVVILDLSQFWKNMVILGGLAAP